ncbi:hypothetical protein ACFE04_002277 [Oxalis oulophora]
MDARLMVQLMFYGCALRLGRVVSKDSEVQTLLERYGFLDFTRFPAHLIEKYKDVKQLTAMNRLLQQTYVRNEYQHQYSLTDIKDFYGCKIDDIKGCQCGNSLILLLMRKRSILIVENLEEINNYSWGKTYIKSVQEALFTKKDNTKISCALGPIIEILRIRPVEFSMKVPLCETWFDVTHYYGSGPNFLKLTHDYKLETTISEYILKSYFFTISNFPAFFTKQLLKLREMDNVVEGYRVDEEEEDLARTLSSFLEKKGKSKRKKTLLKSTELLLKLQETDNFKIYPNSPFGGEDGYIGGEDDKEFNKYSENNVTEEEFNLYNENNVAKGYRVDEEYCTPSQRVEEEDLECTKLVIVEDLAEDGAKKKKIIPMDIMDRMPLYSENNVVEGYRVDEEYCTPSQRVEEEDLACTKLVIVEDLAEDGAKKKKIIPMDSMDRMPLVSAPLYQPKNLRTRIRPNKPYGSCTMGSEFKEETKRHKVEV